MYYHFSNWIKSPENEIVHCIFKKIFIIFLAKFFLVNYQWSMNITFKIIYSKLILALEWSHCCLQSTNDDQKHFYQMNGIIIDWFIGNWKQINLTFWIIAPFRRKFLHFYWVHSTAIVWLSAPSEKAFVDAIFHDVYSSSHVDSYMHLFAQLCWCVAVLWKFLFPIYWFILIHLACVCSHWHAIKNLNKRFAANAVKTIRCKWIKRLSHSSFKSKRRLLCNIQTFNLILTGGKFRFVPLWLAK